MASWGLAFVLLQLAAAHVRADADDYQRLLRDGVNEFAAGNWGEARLLFRRAHELSPTARTFRGLALCDFELRHYVEAMEECDAALHDTRRPLTPELRQQVQQTLERAREYVAHYTLRVPGAVHEVEVDGKTRTLADHGELLLDPGSHTVSVQPASGPAITRELTVEVGAHEELALLPPTAAEPAPVPEAPVAQPLSVPSEPVQQPAAQSGSPRVYSWVAAGLTGAFGVGIAAFGLTATAKHSEYMRQIAAGSVPDPKLKSSGQTLATLTTASIVGCAVAAAATVTLFIVEGDKHDDDAAPSASLRAGVGPGGVVLHGTF